MNILIVEDDDLIAESIAMALEDEGLFTTSPPPLMKV